MGDCASPDAPRKSSNDEERNNSDGESGHASRLPSNSGLQTPANLTTDWVLTIEANGHYTLDCDFREGVAENRREGKGGPLFLDFTRKPRQRAGASAVARRGKHPRRRGAGWAARTPPVSALASYGAVPTSRACLRIGVSTRRARPPVRVSSGTNLRGSAHTACRPHGRCACPIWLGRFAHRLVRLRRSPARTSRGTAR